MSEDSAQPRGFLGMPPGGWVALGSMSGFCAIITLMFGVFQYTTSLEASRAKQTLELIAEWREDGYRDHFLRLADLADVQMQKLTPAEMAFLQDNVAAQKKAAAKVAKLVLEQGAEAPAALDEVVYFFNFMGLCVEAKLCSERTAAGFFDSTIVNFFDIFESPIRLRQKTRPDYASGLIYLVEKFGS